MSALGQTSATFGQRLAIICQNFVRACQSIALELRSLSPESGHSSAAPLRPNKVVNVVASEYDPNQLTISHSVHELLVANIIACAGI